MVKENVFLQNAFCCILMSFFVIGQGYAQQKFEKESRLCKDDLPPFALDFESVFTDRQRIKWYHEQGLERESFEAKYKRAGKKFSVEFDTLGSIEDVEIITEFTALPDFLWNKIKGTVDDQCERYTIDKVQVQYVGDQSVLKEVSQTGTCESCTVNYEVVARLKIDDEYRSFEYLFNDKGEILRRSEIVIQTSSHLEY